MNKINKNCINNKLKTKIVGTLFNVQNSPKKYSLGEIADKIIKVVNLKFQEVEQEKVKAFVSKLRGDLMLHPDLENIDDIISDRLTKEL